ncbi:hypothetical protein Esi_0105_0012 [Ectocarpus siliculosus]|uniref:Uncharacterized protein n=1 Tax=Ectocarpus siliculosus TaxID=2880 RepID=D7FH41_ECTSI|nr:hypothetical protein Esi_0105_0012 [Ectocarpus siliculosus]|eukprot:CBJ28416.1 hypothetical protein Esi_0105_0012 [Ectocarpus siliculosus]
MGAAFLLEEPSPDGADRFYQQKGRSRGGQQLLMTKVCSHQVSQAEDGAESRKNFLLTKKKNTLLGRTYLIVRQGDIPDTFRAPLPDLRRTQSPSPVVKASARR